MINNTLLSKEIAERFYFTLDELKRLRIIRGIATFAKRYDIDRRNFATARRIGSVNVAWIAHVVRDYNISPDYILNGVGGMFREA